MIHDPGTRPEASESTANKRHSSMSKVRDALLMSGRNFLKPLLCSLLMPLVVMIVNVAFVVRSFSMSGVSSEADSPFPDRGTVFFFLFASALKSSVSHFSDMARLKSSLMIPVPV